MSTVNEMKLQSTISNLVSEPKLKEPLEGHKRRHESEDINSERAISLEPPPKKLKLKLKKELMSQREYYYDGEADVYYVYGSIFIPYTGSQFVKSELIYRHIAQPSKIKTGSEVWSILLLSRNSCRIPSRSKSWRRDPYNPGTSIH